MNPEYESLENEVELEAYDPTRVKNSYNKYGCVLMRQVLDRENVLKLGRDLKAEFDRLHKIKETLSDEARVSLARNEMPADEIQARFRLEPYKFSVFTESKKLQSTLRTLLGEDYVWHYPPMYRELNLKDRDGILPYHQDYSYNNKYEHMMVCWTPLVDCGNEAPGLEVILKRIFKRCHHEPGGRWENGMSPENCQKESDNAPVWNVPYRAGDLMIFDELTFHRTYATANMTKSRFSLDARAIPLSVINDKLKQTRRFIRPDQPEFARLQ